MGLFDTTFPGNIESELQTRESYVSNKNVRWNYDKFAWIQMRATGKSSTIACPTAYGPIGDGTAGTQVGHNDLYVTEGGVRKFKPQLKSVSITNQGAQDYTDALIYEIEASFTAYTTNQLNAINDAFFKAGSEVEFKFGWEGYASGVNKGSCKANVYNFSFTMADDGSFDCTIKCMSAAGLWASDDMGGTSKAADSEDGNKYADFLQTLKTDMRASFGLDAAADVDEVDDIGNNGLASADYSTNSYGNARFYAAEIVVDPGIFDEEQFVSYCSINTLINYINFKSESTLATTKYEIGTGTLGEWPIINEIGSADPSKFVLPGNQGNYGDPRVPNKGWFDGDISKNFAKWGSIIASDSQATSLLGKIAVSIEYMDEIYAEVNKAAGRKGGTKVAPKVSEFLSSLFAKLENLTGGLLHLTLIPHTASGELMQVDNQELTIGNPMILKLCNKKMVSNKADAKQTPYTFKTLTKDSITRAVSLSTDMDSDTMLMMTPSNIAKGTSNLKGAEKLDTTSCRHSEKVIAETSDDNPSKFDIETIRFEYGAGGYDNQKISSYSEMCKNYILRNSETDDFSSGRYNEVVFAYDLSVTIDGIWGIPFMAPILIDRIPNVFKGPDILFSVTGVSHTFDGQGDWSTELSTVMRIV